MDAAKHAARAFVKKQPSTIKVGIVAFSDGGLVVQQPTNVKRDVLAAIDRLAPQGGTSLSEGMFTSLGAIAGKPIAVDQTRPRRTAGAEHRLLRLRAVIVMLSDGEQHLASIPSRWRRSRRNAGVRVFPIGVGSPDGTVLEIDGFHVATALDAAASRRSRRSRRHLLRGRDETELAKVYDRIDLKLTAKGGDRGHLVLASGALCCS